MHIGRVARSTFCVRLGGAVLLAGMLAACTGAPESGGAGATTAASHTPAVTAVLAGEVNGGVLATPGMLPHVKAGKIVPLAVTSRKRSTLAPDIPTIAEAGLPQLEQEVFYLAMVPAATPEPVVQAIQKAMGDALARAEVRARLEGLDLHYEGLTGAAAGKRLAELSERYGKVIRVTGMKVE